ncbi:hypothetical protein V1525DRAFT_100666 [Lipomyces kononenkoae]|uniref:Uncharacterized protein n=1 Tax=Lipomyces kononenkoae TaxID=34357 RepID=A0ACC3T5B0_LIPKO
MTRSFATETNIDIDERELEVERLATSFQIVLITLGARGVFFSIKTGSKALVPCVEVEQVVGTTAAGDMFVGYFATAFAKFVATGASRG